MNCVECREGHADWRMDGLADRKDESSPAVTAEMARSRSQTPRSENVPADSGLRY